MSLFKFNMTNDFANEKYSEYYADRLPNSECINGFHKRKTGMLYLLCRNFTANVNKMVFRNLLYKIRRLRSLKDTIT